MFFVLLVLCTFEIQGIISAAPADTSPLTESPALPVPIVDDALNSKSASVLAAAPIDESRSQFDLPAAPAIIVDVAKQPELTDVTALFRTTYECGTSLYGSEVLIIGGKLARRGEVPWHAGIYRKITRSYAQICGGTLISNSIIISAAHCFWNGEDEQPPPDRFAVAVGKMYQKLQSDIFEEEEQNSDVKEIHVPDLYQASDANYQEDIAVVIVASPFQYTNYVRPVCVDFRRQLEKKQLQTGNYGKVAGWGLTSENGGSSQVLKLIKLPYVDTRTCIMESPLTFRGHITGDKFCAGYKNSKQAVCLGDSGGGLAFPLTEKGRTRYYLRGVVSAAPDSDRQCNANDITTFTRLLKHEYFIRQFWDFEQSPAATCDPIPLALTTQKTGQKAWDKCIEYQEMLVYPCSETITGGYVRNNRCHHNASGGFTDGNEVQQHEFTHMAFLGFGNDITSLQWKCGGSLISEKFVVSSLTCTELKHGISYFVAVGDINELTDKNCIKVKKSHRHPEFKLYNSYQDLGLLELEKTLILNQFLVPACIHTGDNIIDDLAVTTKWGYDKQPYEMKKMLFAKTSPEPCKEDIPGSYTDTLMCYIKSGPAYDNYYCTESSQLFLKNTKIGCMYTIIGVRPYTILCTASDIPTTFASVALYLDWIEKTVWP